MEPGVGRVQKIDTVRVPERYFTNDGAGESNEVSQSPGTARRLLEMVSPAKRRGMPVSIEDGVSVYPDLPRSCH